MCGRFALTPSPEEVRELFGLLELEDFPARYNIAPTQPVLAVASGEAGGPGSDLPERRAVLVRWGLTPAWVKDPREFPLLFNARAETAAGKASFRAAMRHRRVLVPASGFYEWHRPAKESGEAAQAYWIRPKRGGAIAFAGLMETWSSADGSEIDTGAILTIGANAMMARIHARMPVVIEPEDFARWLDCLSQAPRDVADLMVPPPEDFFETIPVSDRVNAVRNVGPDLQEPVEPQAALPPENRSDEPVDRGDGRQMSLF